MPTAKEAKEVTDIFVSLLNNRDVRLARGARLRQEMHEKFAKGERPTGYRADWIRGSATKILRELQKLGLDFNATHTDDQCSVNDLMDVLTTAIGHLKKRQG